VAFTFTVTTLTHRLHVASAYRGDGPLIPTPTASMSETYPQEHRAWTSVPTSIDQS
jgi:hypothetical protein